MNWLITVVILAIMIGGIWYLLDDDGQLAFDITPNPTVTSTSTPFVTVTESPVASASSTATAETDLDLDLGQGGEEFNFFRNGTLVRNTDGLPANTWYFRYNAFGRTGLLARIVFNSESTCWVNGSFMACNAAPLLPGMTISIEGNLNTAGEDTLEVHELKVISTPTPTPFPVSPIF